MAIAFDAVTTLGTGTGNLSATHTPVGTPRGALVLVVQNSQAVDHVTGVTYGGTAMTEVALSPLLHATGSEDGTVYGYFLGSSVPTGAQTVTVTVDSALARAAYVFTVTAAADTEVDDTSVLDDGGVQNPSVTLTATADCFVAAALHSGEGDPANVDPGADFTEPAVPHDFGTQTAGFLRRTNIASAGSVTVDWVTANVEENGILAVAIKESGAAPAGNLLFLHASGLN